MQTAEILGYTVCGERLEGSVQYAWEMIEAKNTVRYVACLNPHSLVVASSDDSFRTALADADILLPDGAGIVLAARILKEPVQERVAGSEFFLKLTAYAQQRNGVRYYFLGSTRHVLEKIKERIQRDFSAVHVAGMFSPPFKEYFSEEENLAMIETINKSRPDVLWVGMTAPKQEKWIHANRHRLQVPLIGAIGAVFDFYAGTRKRAPTWVCGLGLEWLPRLLREPTRLMRRNLISSPIFLLMVLQEKIRRILGR